MSKILSDEFYTSEQFQKFFEKSANSMIIKANPPHFTILAASNQFLEITHRNKQELLGNDLYDMFPGSADDDSEMLNSYETFVKAIETRKRVDWPIFKYEIFNPVTGEMEVQYWSNYNEPILDDEGNVAHIINTTNNATAQVLETAEKELAITRLKASEQNVLNMVRQAPVGMCIIQGDFLHILEVNDYFLDIIGKTRAQVKHKPYWEVIPEAAAYYGPITDNVLKSGQTYRAKEHEVLLCKNGKEETVHVDFVYEPMKDADNQVFAIMIVAIDVTDKVRVRKELENAYEQVRLSKQAAQLGMFDMNVLTGAMEWDDRCRLLFGISHQGPVSFENDFILRLYPDDQERVTKLINDLFTQVVKGGDYDVEYRTIGAEDGIMRWVRAKGKVFFNEHNEPVRFIGSVIDITDQKEDEQRKNDFIGMVSHELKTPLTSLTAYIQMLLSKSKKGEDQFTTTALEKANLQVKKMSAMINGFLNISRLESGKIHLQKQYFDIEALVRELVGETLIVSPNHMITFDCCEPTIVFADRDKIASVISNMLSNALKYSPKGKYIEVSCKKADHHVQLSVRDEGMGIKEQDLEKLFERYYRVETKHTEHISGFGIGLYLSAEIIERHNGKIWAESISGVGSTFSFSLPLN